MLQAEIAASGPGVGDDIRGPIMEPYFTTKGDGSGMGLALIGKIVAQRAGAIEFDTPAGGTRLPAEPCDRDAQ